MAKTIATIGGVALAPGVSKNGRLYTREAIAKMVARAQERITSGGRPLTMLSHHGAEDDSTRIVGRITSITQDDDGAARYTAGIADTEAGRDIATLLDTSDGKPAFLRNSSIRGFWAGPVKKITGPEGVQVETSSDLELDGMDLTKSPGVSRAGVDAFAWATGGRTETTERVAITESVQEARVTITEDAGPDAAPVISEAALDIFGAGHVLENGLCATCAAVAEGGDAPGDGSKPYGDVSYADPGYQSDKKKRYPVDTKAHARAAYSYLSQKSNAARYSPAQLKRIKGRIKAALKKFGVSVAAESAGWTLGEPVAVSEALAEWWPGADPQTSGAYCLTASNGPTSLTISSCYLDPEDLDPVIRAAADAACQALAALDPDMDGDMDGDIDVPGAPGADTDHDTGRESAPGDDDETEETSPADEAGEDAAPAAATEEEAVSDTTTTEAAAAAPATVTLTTEQFEALMARTAPPAAPVAATETAPAETVPAAPAAPVAETADQRMERLTALAEAKVAEAAQKAGLQVTETDEQIMERLIEERLVPLRQAAAEKTGSGTARKGLLDSIAEQGPGTTKVLQEASGADLSALAAAAYPAPYRR